MKDLLLAEKALWQRAAEEEVRRVLGREGLRNGGSFCEKLYRFFMESLGRDVTLTDAAEAMMFNQDYLGRICRKTTGYTYHHMALEVQMACARAILAETGCSVQAMAEYLGYATPDYFTAVFRRHHGITPSQWKKINVVPVYSEQGRLKIPG